MSCHSSADESEEETTRGCCPVLFHQVLFAYSSANSAGCPPVCKNNTGSSFLKNFVRIKSIIPAARSRDGRCGRRPFKKRTAHLAAAFEKIGQTRGRNSRVKHEWPEKGLQQVIRNETTY